MCPIIRSNILHGKANPQVSRLWTTAGKCQTGTVAAPRPPAGSAPVQLEADLAAVVLVGSDHVDDLPGLVLDRRVREQLEVAPVLAERRHRLLDLIGDVDLVHR